MNTYQFRMLTDAERDMLDYDDARREAYDEPRECRWHTHQTLDADGMCEDCAAEPCPHCGKVPLGRTWQGYAYCFACGWQEGPA